MIRKPEFITFTGADDTTRLDAMIDLARLYPVEWGILFSPTRQGQDARYPDAWKYRTFLSSGLRLSAHLCGGHSRAVMAGQLPPLGFDWSEFSRVQVNHTRPEPWRIAGTLQGRGPRPIAQSRGHEFPESAEVDWLFDASGGRGLVPTHWPRHPGRLVGYAGGINPDNVLSIITAIDAPGPYWIDMESGVRTGDRFDLDLCRQVCISVYGPACRPVEPKRGG